MIYFKAQFLDNQREIRENLKEQQDNVNKIFGQYNTKFGAGGKKFFDEEVAWFSNLSEEEKEILLGSDINYDVMINSTDPYTYLQGLIDRAKELQRVMNPQSNITDSVEALNAKVNPQMNTLTDIYSSMLGDSGLNPSEFSNEQMQSLIDSFKSNDELGIEFNTEELEEFFEVLADGEATVDETQEAFDKLATKWIESSKAIDTLNVNNREYINQQLEQMGITNAEEMTAAELISQQIDLANATYKVSMEEAKAIENKEESKKAINDTYICQHLHIDAIFVSLRINGDIVARLFV
jgi:hypothetical protein